MPREAGVRRRQDRGSRIEPRRRETFEGLPLPFPDARARDAACAHQALRDAQIENGRLYAASPSSLDLPRKEMVTPLNFSRSISSTTVERSFPRFRA